MSTDPETDALLAAELRADDPSDPFHAGERALQSMIGARDAIAEVGRRIMRDAMPEQHRELFARLPFMLIGHAGDDGPHASLLAGPPGFAHAPDPRHLTLDVLPHAQDPLAGGLRVGASLGLLGIEPHTRRRNRMNGGVSEVGNGGFTVRVEQSFSNCPKYIQARQARWQPTAVPAERQARRSARLDSAAAELIATADTFYIASAYSPRPGEGARSHGVDVSHRGGKPGFVRVECGAGRDTLTVPDFSGNAMFNTLGNLAMHPRAGLLFIDYARGDLLHVAVDTQIIWEGAELASFEGAERLLRLHVRGALYRPAALALTWTEPELSPFVLATGQWPGPEP